MVTTRTLSAWVTDGTTYDTYYIKFNEYDKSAYKWGDYIKEDTMVIIAAPQALSGAIEAVLEQVALVLQLINACVSTTTTSTTTTVWPSTSTTTTLDSLIRKVETISYNLCQRVRG